LIEKLTINSNPFVTELVEYTFKSMAIEQFKPQERNIKEGTERKTLSSEGEKLLDAYNWFRDPEVVQSFIDAVREVLPDKKEKAITILGIGAGAGLLESAVKENLQKGGRLVKIFVSDILEDVVQQIKDEELVRFVADNKSLPIKDQTLDLAISRSVTHYESSLEDELKVLKEIRRILKDGGYFINQALTPIFPSEAELLRKVHAVLPKYMNIQSKQKVKEMLDSVFPGGVREAESQADKWLIVTRGDFVKRYAPKLEDFENEEEYNQAMLRFEEKLAQIINLIQSVPKEERPNIKSDGYDFTLAVPYTTFICKKI